MNSEEFLNKVKESGVVVYFRDSEKGDYHWSNPKEKWKTLVPKFNKLNSWAQGYSLPIEGLSDECCLRIEWTTGGTAGGSWRDDGTEDKHYGVEGEPEPEFEALDKLLEFLCPSITFLQYKKMSGIIKRESRHENEYYGNSTEHGIEPTPPKSGY